MTPFTSISFQKLDKPEQFHRRQGFYQKYTPQDRRQDYRVQQSPNIHIDSKVYLTTGLKKIV